MPDDRTGRLLTITRATDLSLYQRMVGTTSAAARQMALSDGLERLQETVGGTDSKQSPAARITLLARALQQFANAPDDRHAGQAVIAAAKNLANGLNEASQTIQRIRDAADRELAASVSRVDGLLERFGALNRLITQGSSAGDDVTSELDQRDGIVSQLSEELGLTIAHRAFNDMAIYTDGGVPLFDVSARTIRFVPTPTLAPGVSGAPLVIDGVSVTGDTTMPLRFGRLAGLTQLRDAIAPTYQVQLDEIARGLIETFAETDNSGVGEAAATGLFVWSGQPAMTKGGTVFPGLAREIAVNAAVDPTQGGENARLRDGGINGSGFVRNRTGAASFPDQLNGLINRLNGARAFADGAAIGSPLAIGDFASASVNWLENLRQTAAVNAEFEKTVLVHASNALSNATGVNIDDEYATVLQLENGYVASARLIGLFAKLFDQLMMAVK